MNTFRQSQIRDFIEKNYVVTIKQLQELIPNVSLMTIHRDLDTLEKLGVVVKIRGGARAVRHSGDLGFDVRIRENISGKILMAQKAMSLIKQGSSVFLDASTTNLILARNLPDIAINVITTGPNIAIELCKHANINITLCCGTVNRKNMSLFGQNTLEMLLQMNIDTAFIGVSGCSADSGFTCGTEGDMVIKHAAIQKARTSVAMCDSTKFSRLMPYTFAKFADVDYLISDAEVPDAVRQVSEAENVILL